MQKGFINCTNITTSSSNPPVLAKSVFKGNGDPGYLLSASKSAVLAFMYPLLEIHDPNSSFSLSVMISESALSLLLPPPSVTTASGTPSQSKSLPPGLPSLARKGGILTPMTAFGDVLLTRLIETGRFEFEHGIVGTGTGSVEGRKNV